MSFIRLHCHSWIFNYERFRWGRCSTFYSKKICRCL